MLNNATFPMVPPGKFLASVNVAMHSSSGLSSFGPSPVAGTVSPVAGEPHMPLSPSP